MKRLFIAINIPENIKNKIDSEIYVLENAFKNEKNVGFIPRQNWHLTIIFLGEQPIESIGLVLNSTKESAKIFSAPKIEFNEIILAPPDKPARMLWLTASKETSLAIEEIKNNIENNLIINGVKFLQERRKFNGHITLARASGIIKNTDKIADFKNINLSFIAGSLDLMESHLKPSGAEYEILSSFSFGNR